MFSKPSAPVCKLVRAPPCNENRMFIGSFCLLGLKLELNIEQYEYLSELTNEAGVRVFIGHQDLMPFPYELGISAPPGDSTEIMLRKVWSRK